MTLAKTYTLQMLFAGRPASLKLFRMVRKYLQSLDSVQMSVGKTQVSFGTSRKFAWVWLPQKWVKKRPDNSITLAFSLPKHVKHKRIEAAVEPYPKRWTHHVIIEKESDLDERVKSWLLKAFKYSARTQAKDQTALKRQI